MSERKRFTFERTFEAPVEDVWELWTTRAGVESWGGPEGFRVKVHAIDPRPVGEMRNSLAIERYLCSPISGLPTLVTASGIIAAERPIVTSTKSRMPSGLSKLSSSGETPEAAQLAVVYIAKTRPRFCSEALSVIQDSMTTKAPASA